MHSSGSVLGLRRRIGASWPNWRAAARNNRLEIGIFTGIVAVAAALRLWDLGRVGFRGDEAVYAGQAAVLAGDHGMDRYFILASRGNSNFLIFQEILSVVYRVFGVSDVGARVVGAVFSILTVVAIYFLARLLYGRRAAAFAAGALALSGYAIGLGRLALLDSTATFFVVMGVLFLALWLRTPRDHWLCAFAAATMLAAQAKVAGILLLVVFAGVLVVNGAWRHLRWRSIVQAVLVSLLALTPALIQVVLQPRTIVDFLGSSLHRHSATPWYYYGDALLKAEGPAILIALLLGIVLAAFRTKRTDLLPWLWLAVFGLFYMVYPLKAFNYLLPLVPALALLGGRGLALVRMPRIPQLALATGLAVICGVFAAPSVASAVHDDSSAGMREAARWIAANTPSNAGVMALSQGSGQYVYSFYAQRDAYPYGGFRLATVLPGGAVSTPRQTPVGVLPQDWISDQPVKLIQEGVVSYLVYSTGSLDDPPEQAQILNTQTERQFRSLIESVGGRLVHQVTWNHEVRVYIYRVTKRDLHPVVRFVVEKGRIHIKGSGFVEDSPIAVTYHGETLASTGTDTHGSVDLSVAVPKRPQRPYHLVLTDAEGNYASARGLPAPVVEYAVEQGKVVVRGQQFSAGARVTIAYHGRTLARTTADAKGTVTATLPSPVDAKTRYQLRLTDSYGLTAWTAGIEPALMRFTVQGTNVQVTGLHFEPSGIVSVSYHGHLVGRPKADAAGSFSTKFTLPAHSAKSYQLKAVDANGRSVVAVGLGGRH